MSVVRKAPSFELIHLAGPVGDLECLHLAAATAQVRGIALVAHPNPREGGTFNNKIVHTLAKTFSRLGYIAYCPNLRGVGHSEGVHDFGVGEVDDMAAVLAHATAENPHLPELFLAGFSFGTYVQSQLQARLSPGTTSGMILVGPAISRHDYPAVLKETLIIHGELDEVIPLSAVMDWARPQQLPITVLPGASHFFHGFLPQLAQIASRHIGLF